MKNTIVLFLILGCIVTLFAGCNDANIKTSSIEFSIDSEGRYTGFSKLPSNYTIKKAENDGYYVTQDLEVIANTDVWDDFIKTSAKEINTSIRMVKFYTDDANSPYFIDLFYEDGYYYLFDSSANNKEKQPFSYLLTLEGQFGNPLRNSGVVILTNDNSLTFDMVMSAITSSDMSYIQSISPHEIVMFQ